MPASAALGMICTVSEGGEELRVDPIQGHDASPPTIQGLRLISLRNPNSHSPMIFIRWMASKAKPDYKGIFGPFGSPAISNYVSEARSFPRAPHDAVGLSGSLPMKTVLLAHPPSAWSAVGGQRSASSEEPLP